MHCKLTGETLHLVSNCRTGFWHGRWGTVPGYTVQTIFHTHSLLGSGLYEIEKSAQLLFSAWSYYFKCMFLCLSHWSSVWLYIYIWLCRFKRFQLVSWTCCNVRWAVRCSLQSFKSWNRKSTTFDTANWFMKHSNVIGHCTHTHSLHCTYKTLTCNKFYSAFSSSV